MLHSHGSHRKKSAFPPYIIFMMKQTSQFGWATSRVDDTRSYGSVLILQYMPEVSTLIYPRAALALTQGIGGRTSYVSWLFRGMLHSAKLTNFS